MYTIPLDAEPWAHDLVIQLDRRDATINALINAVRLRLPSFTVEEAQSFTANAGDTIYITDETGGAVTASSDGTVFRRSTDRAAIS